MENQEKSNGKKNGKSNGTSNGSNGHSEHHENGQKLYKKSNGAIDNPFEAYSQSSGDLRKFTDELLNQYKGKILELYIGDQSETLNYDEVSVPKNCCIFGKLIDVLDRVIVLDCYYIDPSGIVRSGNKIIINSFQIRAMTEVDGNGSLGDVFLSVSAAKKIRSMIRSGNIR